MNITFTQFKQMNANGFTPREAAAKLDRIPEWAHLNSISEIQGIIQCGCASNAHISCYYYEAKSIFFEHSDEIDEVLLDTDGGEGFTFKPDDETFPQFVSHLLQTAVECVAYRFDAMLSDVDWA